MPGLSTIDWTIIIVYLCFAVGVGVWASRRAGVSTDSYFVAGRSLPWWVAGTSMVATTFAADTPLWVAGVVATRGIAGNWFWWTLAIPHVLAAVLFARMWRRSEVVTDAGVTEVRYSGKPAAVLRGVKAFYFAVPINCIVMGWVILAMQKILGVFISWELLLPQGWFVAIEAGWPAWVGHLAMIEDGSMAWSGLDPNTGLSLIVCITLAVTYSVLGGIRGVVLTDMVQFALAMVGAIAVAWFAVSAVGGLGELRSGLESATGDSAGILAWMPPAQSTWMPLHLFAMYLLVLWWAQRNSDGGGYFVQRMAACKDASHAAKATLWFTFCHYVVRTWPWILAALAALVLYPPLLNEGMDREAAYPMLMRDVLPVGLLGIAVASLIAAFMSTIDTHVNWGASYLVTDVYKRFIRPNASERHHVVASRLTVVLMAVTAALISTQMGSIDAAWKLFMALGAGLGLPHLARWFWWRTNAWTELSALVSTTVIALLAFLVFPRFGAYATLAPPTQETIRVLSIVIGSTAVWLPVTLLTKATHPDVLDAFYIRVRPLGFWGPVRARCAGVSPLERGRSVLLAWVVGIAFVYLLLFGMGELLIGRWWLGALLVPMGIGAGWWTYRLMMSGNEEAKAEPKEAAGGVAKRAASVSLILLAGLLLAGCNGEENGQNGSDNGGDEPAAPGEPCPGGDPAGCESGVHLIGFGGQCWCSAYCASSGDCPADFPCQRYPFDGDHRDICAPPCERDNQCPSGTCRSDEGLCDPPVEGEEGLGEACGGETGTCTFGLVCIRHGAAPRCMETCALLDGPLCRSGAVCYQAQTPQGGVCWLGGELGLDTPCSGEFDCISGHLCVIHTSGRTCRPACDTDLPEPCAEGMGACQPLGEDRLGACLP